MLIEEFVEPMNSMAAVKIAVLVPCLNEELTIGKVVRDFQRHLPGADIYVFDNNCTDRTPEIARQAGAVVYEEKRLGKGYVIASMFKMIHADVYLLVDGDDTYPAEFAPSLLEPLVSGRAGMTVASRLSERTDKSKSFRRFHVFGNNLVKSLVNRIFQSRLNDIMSGYRGVTREFVETVPVLSSGFEVETELTLRALEHGFTIEEIEVPYRERPHGSYSKLHTFRDGYRVLIQILTISKAYKPFTFFGIIGLFFGILGLGSGVEVIIDFLEDRYVDKVPTAVLSSACILLSFGSFGIGIVLNALNFRFRELVKIIQKIRHSDGNR